MNESLFVIHCLGIVCFMLGALRMGKEMLMTFISLCWLLANFFVTKQIMLFGCEITASDVYAVGGILGTSVLQELWGKKAAILSIWISFFIQSAAIVCATIHLLYEASPHDTMQSHFIALLHPTPRLLVASLVTFFIAGRVEVRLLSYAQRFRHISFTLRSGIIAFIVTLIDTGLFTLIGLYGIASSLTDIIIVSSAIKLSLVLIMTPFLSFTRRLSTAENS